MMINKRLIKTVPEAKRHIAGNVAMQWIALIANMVIIFTLGWMIQGLYQRALGYVELCYGAAAIILCLGIKFICGKTAARQSYLASKSVKSKLRDMIFRKLLALGGKYTQKSTTAEVLQSSVEGVEQLETYFGAYLPQFFYSLLAPITLFAVLSFISVKAAAVLLVCVPLIPVSIVLVQKFAKRLLAKYWGQYTKMGDSFLENLQGLTTLKVYQADEHRHQKMNEEAESFRKITMKVLTMQLNSITVMDLIAYGGAALGAVLSVLEFRAGNISLSGCFILIMLAADFFLPLRALGSYFHVAMNGMAASDRIFALLDAEEGKERRRKVGRTKDIAVKDLSFSYDGERPVLQKVSLNFPENSFTAIVGESGCGKSTMASILMGLHEDYEGQVTIGGIQISEIAEENLMENLTLIAMGSYIFKGSVRENLLMGNPQAEDAELWSALEKVNLAEYVKLEGGLDMALAERGANLSGGQCQRLALARALLHDTPIYIFDEATSNIDMESENDIMEILLQLAVTKTVILISHRLANVVGADRIYVLNHGTVVEEGSHQSLLEKKGLYAQLWNTQASLEQYGLEERNDEEKFA